MTKFLIAMVLWLLVVKYISGCNAFDYHRYNFAELIQQGEESEQEKGEEGKSKNDNQDNIFVHTIAVPLLNTPANHLKIPWERDAYLDFINSPNTPPPDAV